MQEVAKGLEHIQQRLRKAKGFIGIVNDACDTIMCVQGPEVFTGIRARALQKKKNPGTQNWLGSAWAMFSLPWPTEDGAWGPQVQPDSFWVLNTQGLGLFGPLHGTTKLVKGRWDQRPQALKPTVWEPPQVNAFYHRNTVWGGHFSKLKNNLFAE